jgi:hypothetical protein
MGKVLKGGLMKPLIITTIALSFILVISSSAFSKVDFRCGNTHVETGMLSDEILKGCGEPITKENLCATGQCAGRKLEKWVYEKGGVQYVLHFKGEVLVKIEVP